MRLVTWNCCRGAFGKKAALLDSLSADVTVIQDLLTSGSLNFAADFIGLGIVIIVVGFRHFRLHPDQNQRTWDRRRAAQQQVPS